ncbi:MULTISPECIES: Fe-S cluster assembly transcriptional regulator IscR [Gammaproteobacteria]|uniref:Fe-S cluster assembly transcriptional regulator IscR n=1 Tax=Gammaproteobacteria TaxID=1236 RepID=UPI000DD0CF21|nr:MULTISPECIES: Fe-S cluster assembly transcriptional regulator IscR [Gammaproteobacteria]RTE87092.1 Fe-S cluster assembly transcriptional regulator IscR [Aliidiomarina sp. B3213]TCZ93119.1 Fe-S cluster assembly transcriptional regulator IscR [Lysobacter sp. N42]
MRLTSKGRYAVTAMLDVALHGNEAPVPLSDIALRQGISLSYLEQLFAKLRRASIVQSIRGPGGGYKLLKDPEEVSVGHIIQAVNESVDATKCHGKSNCHAGEQCITHHLWTDLSDRIADFLDEISLASLMTRSQQEQAAVITDKQRIPVQPA